MVWNMCLFTPYLCHPLTSTLGLVGMMSVYCYQSRVVVVHKQENIRGAQIGKCTNFPPYLNKIRLQINTVMCFAKNSKY